MTVTLHSVFDQPLPGPSLAEGIRLGRNWHHDEGPVWSRAHRATLIVDVTRWPVPTAFWLECHVFNATPEAPRSLRIVSPGHAPVELRVTDGGPRFVRVETPHPDAGAAFAEMRIEIDRLTSPAAMGQSADERALGVLLGRMIEWTPAHAFPLDFSRAEVCAAYLRHGWSAPEPGGVWSVGPRAKLHLPAYLDLPRRELTFDLASLPRPAGSGADPLEASVKINGEAMQSWIFAAGRGPSYHCPLPQNWRPGHPIDIVLAFTNLMSPAELSINKDPRLLGVWLSRIRAG